MKRYTRCLALYHAFRAKGADVKIILDGDASTAGLLRGASHRLLNWRRKGPQTLAVLRAAGIVVADSYLATPDFYAFAARHTRLLVSLDDTNRLPYPPGLVVNGAIAADAIRYPKSKGIRYLLGAAYAPLRKEFWHCPGRPLRKKISRVLVTLGGANSVGLAGKIAAFLKSEFRVSVSVFGRRLRSVSEVRREMLRSDVCVTACGQTTYELAACGVSSIGVGFADNQRLNIKGWTARNAIKFAGWKDEKDLLGRIGKLLSGLSYSERAMLSRRARELIDGRGAQRIAEIALDVYKAPPVFRLRKATARDCLKIYELSNSPEVRGNSINTGKIDWAGHKRWYAGKLKDSAYLFLVAEADGFIGQLRYEVSGTEALVSISISDLFRGKGMAAPMLLAGNKELFASFPSVLRINAYIRLENEASIKAFGRAGHEFKSRVSVNKVMLGKYVAKR